MELWDIYDKNKVRTGRTMERNHFNLADDEYHLTGWTFSDYEACDDKGMGAGLVGSFRRCRTGRRRIRRSGTERNQRGDRIGCQQCRWWISVYLPQREPG